LLGYTVLFDAYFIVCSKSLLGHKALLIKSLKPQATGVVKNISALQLRPRQLEPAQKDL
jgi:hypothetical protein